MALNLIASVAAGSTDGNSVTTPPVDTRGANLLIIHAMGVYNFLYNWLSDSANNDWCAINYVTERTVGTVGALLICKNPATSSNHTFTYGQSNIRPSLCVLAFSDSRRRGQDRLSKYVWWLYGAQLPPWPIEFTLPAITPSENGALLLTGMATPDARTDFQVTEGYSLLAINGSSKNVGGGLAWKEQGIRESTGPTWSWSGGTARCVGFLSALTPVLPRQHTRIFGGF